MKLFYIDQGQGEAIVFIHGMALSHKYWNEYVQELSKTHRTVAVDLLGFGNSPESKEGYAEEQHIEAIHHTLKSLDLKKPYTVVGHSMGGLIALKYTKAFQNEVSKLVMIAPPVYTGAKQARADITKSRRLLKFVYYGASSHVLCYTWCKTLRPLSSRLAQRYLKHLPKDVAADTVRHTWHAYADSMKSIIEGQQFKEDLVQIKIKTVLLYGDKDRGTVLHNVRALELPPQVELVIAKGAHHLPLENTELITRHILG